MSVDAGPNEDFDNQSEEEGFDAKSFDEAADPAEQPKTIPPGSFLRPHPAISPQRAASEHEASRGQSSDPAEDNGGDEAMGAERRTRLSKLALAALGIVYGDIGTSPLYALRECFHGSHAVAVSRPHVLGVLSLMFWSLTLVVSLKYVTYVMRADNRGEGGVLALTALATSFHGRRGLRHGLLLVGLFGAALLFGDGMITPAISVLSAVEGLAFVGPDLGQWVVPITAAILLGLFLLQKRGTGGIGMLFGPVTLVWFATLATLGVFQIIHAPAVLQALWPGHAVTFLQGNGWTGFLVLGAVFLVVTGAEALYADLGHFGTRPIRLTWFFLVMPSLVLNYFGQGALLLDNPQAAENPFYHLAPGPARYALLGLATAATIIASQAVISGVFSLTRQAVMLGYWPHVRIEHTSEKDIGQVYVPSINWTLMVATVGLVALFQSSSALSAAYGLAVASTMLITSVLAFVVARHRWHWPLALTLSSTAVFIVVDLAFLGANTVKLRDGGVLPLALALLAFALMTTWRRGQFEIGQQLRDQMMEVPALVERLKRETARRVPGTAVYLTGDNGLVPPVLLHNYKHNGVLHEHVVLLALTVESVPQVPESDRLEVEHLDAGVTQVVARFGFSERPDLGALFREADEENERPSFFVARRTLALTATRGQAGLRRRLFAWMSRLAPPDLDRYGFPTERVIEIGQRIEL